MVLTDPALNFVRVISNRESVTPSVRTQVLGGEKLSEWKVRTEPEMIRHVEHLLELGNRHLKSCMDIVRKIRIERNRLSREHSVDMPPVNLVVHDQHAAFDSEAGVGKCGTIFINLCSRYGWIDKNGHLWAVPILVVMYHELGHYLQYVTNRAQYETMANVEANEGHHLLDALNLPDNEYPMCRELGMGIRERYQDMHELPYTGPTGRTVPGHKDFDGKEIHYSNRIPRDKVFARAAEPADVVSARMAQAALRADTKSGAALDTEAKCMHCGTPFTGPLKSAMKQRIHTLGCAQKVAH